MNANLRAELGSPWWAAFASYLVGMVTMLVAALAAPATHLTFATVRNTSWASWTGGLLGATFIAIAIFMVPRLGAAAVLALIVVGQMICSLTVDHFGLFGIAQRSADPLRLVGTALLISGVVLIQWPQGIRT